MTEKPTSTVPNVQPRSAASIALAVVSIGLCVLVEAAILVSRFRFSRLIDDFEMNVSAITRFTIGPVLPTLLAIVILVAIGKEFVSGIRPILDGCNLVMLLVGAVRLMVYVIGVFASLMSLIDSLSS